MIQIQHTIVSPSLGLFRDQFCEKYNLTALPNQQPDQYNTPCVYFGCYDVNDANAIVRNQSKYKIIVWGGTDVTRAPQVNTLKADVNLRHVAISDYIANDLSKRGIEYKRVNITPVNHDKYDLSPIDLGDDVYMYGSKNPRDTFYGNHLISTIQARCPGITFHICHNRSHERDDLIELYKKCFIGLRLTPRDGLPNTVIELGLLGRRTIHNGNLPCSIPWRNIDDIVDIIHNEKASAELTDTIDETKSIHRVHNDIVNYLNNTRDWLDCRYWYSESDAAKLEDNLPRRYIRYKL